MTPAERAQFRILYATDGFAPQAIGGMQAHARRQLETIAAAGYALTSITPEGPAAPTGPLPWRNVALPWPRRGWRDRISPWRYVRELERFGAAVAEAADAVRPHLVYSEGPLLRAWLRRTPRAAPAIFHPHGLEMFQGKGSILQDLKSLPLRRIVADHARRADIVVCLGERGPLQHILRERLGVAPERIAVLPNAAPEVAQAAAARPAPSGASRFLFVGRDEPRKALPLLLAAFAEIDGATLDLVGAAAPPRPGVRGHGEVRDRARLDGFYAEADFLVVPSHAEGMPTVVLEAFAAGLPVIATDVGASGELVRDGETGWLVPRGDRRALVAAMRAAMALPAEDYARLSANCLSLARGRFSGGAVGERLISLLDRLLDGGQEG